MRTFHKTDDPVVLRHEAAGLRWLAAAQDDGGAAVVEILAEGEGWFDLAHLPSATPTTPAAAAFGRALARTHAAGAPSLGCAPPGWRGEVVRSSGPMAHHPYDAQPPTDRWGEFYASYQLRPYVRRARRSGVLPAEGAAVLERVADRLAAGDLDHPQPALVGDGAARLHGDLWGGNVMWTPGAEGARGVLIDPAAHGGHAETDLAALALFGVPRLADILAGYQEVSPLADGWRERVGLHQLTLLMIHVVIFGGHYVEEAVAVAEQYS
ncbi:fructosamine kinase family protein [Georgenia sp. MJ173]|uniref:fructosamine kinase family protein n=1 Tax=Georgenia sunbinii TaxID=3117728 RepID=UPI002F269BB5